MRRQFFYSFRVHCSGGGERAPAPARRPKYRNKISLRAPITIIAFLHQTATTRRVQLN
jgi:hypothetical protein